MKEESTLYDTDFFEWTQRTAELLRQRRFDEVDLEHAAEVRSRATVLIAHLLKWRCQPNLQETSARRATIHEQRRQIELVLADSPSLRRLLAEEFPAFYAQAVKAALAEIDPRLGVRFGPTPPFTVQQVLDDGFLPD